MHIPKLAAWILAGAVVVAAGAFVADRYFLPEKALLLDEAEPMGQGDGMMDDGGMAMDDGASMYAEREGTWMGKAGHTARGTVRLLHVDGAWWLRFEDYEQTQGPDVFLYLTPSEDADTLEEIQAGVKILIDGGPDGGEMTKEGNFNQRLPDGLDPTQYHGAAVWCEQFRVPFGTAPLRDAMMGA